LNLQRNNGLFGGSASRETRRLEENYCQSGQRAC